MALQKAVALTVVGVAAGVAGFLAASGRSRAKYGGHLSWRDAEDLLSHRSGDGAVRTVFPVG
ncbi:hypothetical protein OG429_12440 [Streptomyces sp. NBC_00190]|uniref:hypothetical protein n=1 Tax=unclassified Streptomyces TaxID=2593676 RepID=UPI002E2DC197|nr:hypothetical protein [Streptomyces sp. NBC_00190]WSZ40083.1 hypothetical protein OG239_15455 [Streptomyces sp. NBC_00868]